VSPVRWQWLRSRGAGWLVSAALVALVTGVIELLKPHVPVLSLAVLYLLAVIPVAFLWGIVYAVCVSVASMLAFNFFFLPPLYTFTIQDSRNWFALLVFTVTAVVVSDLASRLRREARETALLAHVATRLLEHGAVRDELDWVGDEVALALGAQSAKIALDGAGRIDSIELHGSRHPAAERRVLPALTSLVAMALDRERLGREALEAETLRRSDAMKTAVLRAVSHDLRTPLMAILTSASALARPELTLTDDERAELLETVLDESHRLDGLVANLLDLSRLQAGAAEPETELVAVDDLVVEALSELGAAGERVEVSLPDHAPAVQVDARQVQRALVNLIENALKFSPASEPVLVRVAWTSTETLVRVIDRGPGVSAAAAERIFSAFQRGDDAGRVPGAGLGLAIAQGFAEANGGRVWVESHEGQGATFVLALPVAAIQVPA